MSAGATTEASEYRGRPLRRLAQAILSADSYGAVLLSILITYALAIVLTGDQAKTLLVVVQISTVWLTYRVARARPAVRRATNVLLAAAGLIAILNLFGLTGSRPDQFLFFASCVLYFVAPMAIVRHVAMRPRVDLETVLGAVAAYLLIGMFFAFAYHWMGEVGSGDFYGAAGDGDVADDLFFSFTTMTTIGFGSLVPAGNPGQTFAVAEGVIGQLFLVVGFAKIVSSWRPANAREEAPPPAG